MIENNLNRPYSSRDNDKISKQYHCLNYTLLNVIKASHSVERRVNHHTADLPCEGGSITNKFSSADTSDYWQCYADSGGRMLFFGQFIFLKRTEKMLSPQLMGSQNIANIHELYIYGSRSAISDTEEVNANFIFTPATSLTPYSYYENARKKTR